MTTTTLMSGNGGKAGRDHVFMRQQVRHQESTDTNMVNPGHGGSVGGV